MENSSSIEELITQGGEKKVPIPFSKYVEYLEYATDVKGAGLPITKVAEKIGKPVHLLRGILFIKPGQIWQNTKRESKYRIVTIAMCAENFSYHVVYQDIDDPNKIWTRSIEEFFGVRDNGVERFVHISS